MNNDPEILLVEDNPHDAELVVRALKKINLATKLFHAQDGQGALDFLFGTATTDCPRLGELPKVVLLDLKLPKMDGIEVLHAIRSHERTKYLPVVMLTSSREERDIIESYKLGANSYIVKPVDFSNFTEAIHNLGLYWALLNQVPLPLQ